MSSDRKAVVKNADMSEEMQQDAVDCATQAIEKFNIEKVRRRRRKEGVIGLGRGGGGGGEGKKRV